MCRVSLIVPYFNTQIDLFISCLQSIQNQSFTNYEVIVVDDGSEGKLSRCAEELFNSMGLAGRFVRKNNGGVSSARNVGVTLARGQYVMFLDSDDLIDPEFLSLVFSNGQLPELILGKIKGCSCDQEPGSLNEGEARNHSMEIIRPDWLKRRFLGAHEVDRDEYSDYRSGPVSCLLLASNAKKQSFDDELSFGEDTVWYLSALDSVSSVGLLSYYAYGYRRVEKSLSTAYRPQMLGDIERFLSRAKSFVSNEAELTEFERLVVIWAFNVFRNQARITRSKQAVAELNHAMDCEPWKTAILNASNLHLPGRYYLFALALKAGLFRIALLIGHLGLLRLGH